MPLGGEILSMLPATLVQSNVVLAIFARTHLLLSALGAVDRANGGLRAVERYRRSSCDERAAGDRRADDRAAGDLSAAVCAAGTFVKSSVLPATFV